MDSFNIQNYFKRGKTVVLTLRHGDEEIRQWADKDVSDLLKLMKAYHSEFQNPRRKKKEVWDDVANELLKSGYNWSSEDCRKKWSNMIRTFKGIEEQKNEACYSTKRLKWSFYDSMLQLLTLENSDAFPEAATVVQMLNSDPNGRASGSASFSRKANTFPKFPPPHSQQIQVAETVHHHQTTAQFLESQRDRDDSINLVSEADLIDMGVSLVGHHDHLASEIQSGGVNGMDPGIIFTQPTRYKTHSDITVPTSSASLSTSVNKASLAVRTKKRPLKRKRNWKDNKVEDSMDIILTKFIETTNKQNEQMLEKMTSFHENALTIMQERNELLRDIRDSLQNNETTDQGDGLVDGDCHETLDDSEDPQGTLTFHVGPAFSISAPNQHTTSNPTLVISNSTATSTSTLSSFQFEDGTVLSNIDGTPSLSSFAQSVLPDVSLLHAVVTENGESSSEMALTPHNSNSTAVVHSVGKR